MIFKECFVLLLLAHIISDFYLQSVGMEDRKSVKKQELIRHCVIYWIVMIMLLLFAMSYNLLLFGTIAVFVHAIIEIIKYVYISNIKKNNELSVQIKRNIFYFEQFVCLAGLFVISYFYAVYAPDTEIYRKLQNVFSVMELCAAKVVSWITAVLIIHKPVNMAISKMLLLYKPKSKDSDRKNVRNAGRLIGTIERSIMLIFISLQQYSAIGLVLTAKSIARYDKIVKEPDFAEYYLLGTLLSTLAVIAVSFIINMI